MKNPDQVKARVRELLAQRFAHMRPESFPLNFRPDSLLSMLLDSLVDALAEDEACDS